MLTRKNMGKSRTQAIRARAKEEGYNCQLTGWEDLVFIKAKREEVLKDPNRKAKIYTRIANKKKLFALFVNNVGIEKDSTIKSEVKAGVKNKREYRF